MDASIPSRGFWNRRSSPPVALAARARILRPTREALPFLLITWWRVTWWIRGISPWGDTPGRCATWWVWQATTESARGLWMYGKDGARTGCRVDYVWGFSLGIARRLCSPGGPPPGTNTHNVSPAIRAELGLSSLTVNNYPFRKSPEGCCRPVKQPFGNLCPIPVTNSVRLSS